MDHLEAKLGHVSIQHEEGDVGAASRTDMSEELALEMTFNNALQRTETHESDSISANNMSEFLKEAGISEADLKDLDQTKFVFFSYMFKSIFIFHLEIRVPMMKCWPNFCNTSWTSNTIAD